MNLKTMHRVAGWAIVAVVSWSSLMAAGPEQSKSPAGKTTKPETKTVIYPLKHVSAGNALKMLREQKLATGASAGADERTNSIIVAGPARAQQDVARAIREADRPRAGVLEVYALRNADTAMVLNVAQVLLEHQNVRLAADPKTNSIILYGPPEAHQTMKTAIAMLDKPAPITRQLKVFSLQNADPRSMVKVLAELLPKDSQIAVDERTRSVILSAAPDAAAIAEALLLRMDRSEGDERIGAFGGCELRITWLVSGLPGAAKATPAENLKDAVAELSRLGIKDVRQVAQVVVRTSPQGQFQVKSSPGFQDSPADFTVSGRVREQRGGLLEMQVELSVQREVRSRESSRRERLVNLSTTIVLERNQDVVLGAAPVGNVTSAFVVQVVGRKAAGAGRTVGQ